MSEFDRALDACIGLVEFFRNGHCTSTDEIATRYHVSQRTAQRWLTRVQGYVPLERNGPNYRKAAFRRLPQGEPKP